MRHRVLVIVAAGCAIGGGCREFGAESPGALDVEDAASADAGVVSLDSGGAAATDASPQEVDGGPAAADASPQEVDGGP